MDATSTSTDGKPTKQGTRREMRARRKALSSAEKEHASKVICEKLASDEPIAVATGSSARDCALAVYLASPDEIDLADFIRFMLKRGVVVVAPRWNGTTYELAKIRSLSAEDLRSGPMGILEPAEADIAKPADVAVWITPGLAFTKDGKRLGYGGGWYDRLLAASRADSLKIGVAHGFQLVGDIPTEPHDIRLDRVVTER